MVFFVFGFSRNHPCSHTPPRSLDAWHAKVVRILSAEQKHLCRRTEIQEFRRERQRYKRCSKKARSYHLKTTSCRFMSDFRAVSIRTRIAILHSHYYPYRCGISQQSCQSCSSRIRDAIDDSANFWPPTWQM
jgi:hypothetical protein